jgi:hypothetical protein
MYPQQYPTQGMQPHFGQQIPQYNPQTPQYVPQVAPQQYAQQTGQTPWGSYSPQMISQQLIGQEIHDQLIAAELFRLAQQVQVSAQVAGPQWGKPSRQLIAAELFRLAQHVHQPTYGQIPQFQSQFPQHQQQFQPQFSGSQQVPVWS